MMMVKSQKEKNRENLEMLAWHCANIMSVHTSKPVNFKDLLPKETPVVQEDQEDRTPEDIQREKEWLQHHFSVTNAS